MRDARWEADLAATELVRQVPHLQATYAARVSRSIILYFMQPVNLYLWAMFSSGFVQIANVTR